MAENESFLLAKKLKAHEEWKSQESQRNTDARVKELMEEVHAARAVADAAKRDAAASARAAAIASAVVKDPAEAGAAGAGADAVGSGAAVAAAVTA